MTDEKKSRYSTIAVDFDDKKKLEKLCEKRGTKQTKALKNMIRLWGDPKYD